MNLGLKTAAGALAVIVLGWFAYAHFDQAVDINLGLFELRNVPLPLVIYGSVIVGMLVMVAVGLRSDMRVRDALKNDADEAGVFSSSSSSVQSDT